MRPLAAALVAVAVAVAGCHLVEHDPAELLAARVPPDAVACGEAGWYSGSLPPARACVLAALAAGQPFHVLVDAAVADGRAAVGWAGDGAGFVRLDYQATFGFLLPTDSEEVRWTACAYLESRGADCPSLDRDLCLACVGAAPQP